MYKQIIISAKPNHSGEISPRDSNLRARLKKIPQNQSITEYFFQLKIRQVFGDHKTKRKGRRMELVFQNYLRYLEPCAAK